jgi:hypothetical protein
VRLAAFGFVAALLAAPLAAQAAQPPARFSVTLRASIVDQVNYDRTVIDEECSARRTGSGGHRLTLRSVRPTRIRVSRTGARLIYRPARATVRLTGTTLAGSYSEFRRCRFLPPERVTGKCDSKPLPPASGPADFRRTRPGRISFGRPSIRTELATACGLETRFQLAGWLNLAPGTVDENALLNGRSLRVQARGAADRQLSGPASGDPNLKTTERVNVRWTLTFRRLG